MNKPEILELEDFVPIDKELVKQKFDEIYNIPNNTWEKLEMSETIDLINNDTVPRTLRTFELNMLPVGIINLI